MGAQQSSPSGLSSEQSEKVFYPESQAGTVQVSPQLASFVPPSSAHLSLVNRACLPGAATDNLLTDKLSVYVLRTNCSSPLSLSLSCRTRPTLPPPPKPANHPSSESAQSSATPYALMYLSPHTMLIILCHLTFASLSDHIRSKLAASLSSLKQQEAQLTQQLQASLSQSNTQHESSSSSSGTSSQLLSRDIEEVREKVRRIENKKSLADWPEVNQMKEKVRECYM